MSDRPEGPLSGGTPADINCFKCDSASTELVEPQTPVFIGAPRIYRCQNCGHTDWVEQAPGKRT